MALRIPPPSVARRADRLWQHTCFEAFLAAEGKPNYYEFNFALSGEWAAYGFRSYREAMPLEEEPDPKIVVRSMDDALELEAVIRSDRLAMIQPCKRLRLGLSAVIEENDGRLSYWALTHPPGKPDFHRPDAFAVKMEPPGKI